MILLPNLELYFDLLEPELYPALPELFLTISSS
jgi:hypothetical protein